MWNGSSRQMFAHMLLPYLFFFMAATMIVTLVRVHGIGALAVGHVVEDIDMPTKA